MQSESFLTCGGVPFFFRSEEEMTLQVGMVSYDDGIVIVGDLWQFVEPKFPKLRYGYEACKLRMSSCERIAVACARNMDISSRVAEAIFQRIGPNCTNRWQAIIDIGKDIAKGFDVECLVIFADPKPSLYALLCGAKEGEIRCEEILTAWPSGDAGNPAYNRIKRYYSGSLSLMQLARLGAMVNVSAEKLNNGVVRNMEVVTCDKDGIRKWTKEENAALRREAETLTDKIGAMIIE